MLEFSPREDDDKRGDIHVGDMVKIRSDGSQMPRGYRSYARQALALEGLRAVVKGFEADDIAYLKIT